VLARDPERITELRGTRALFGNILQADEAWILDSRLSTVGLRMTRQSKNAQRIAERLAEHPRVERIHYPSLFADPEQKRIRDAQSDFPGALFSIEVEGGKRGAFEFLRRLKIAKNAVSLGSVETLACHPKTTTHSELDPDTMAEAEISDALVRVSIGIEHWKDLLEDFEQALET
jgi:cystathionine beta-lyase/cystathionine gamma-synthase